MPNLQGMTAHGSSGTLVVWNAGWTRTPHCPLTITLVGSLFFPPPHKHPRGYARRYRVPWKMALFVQILSWYMQIHPGHKLAEGVKPALVDSLSQAFGVAPLFAFYEGLFFLGFAPELYASLAASVQEHRAVMCEEQHNSFHFCH